MAHTNHVFGIYRESLQAETAVDELVTNGFGPCAITVLHQENQASCDFAEKKHTRPPEGTDSGATASLPLEGSWGIQDPGAGPREGALPGALDEIGVPRDWSHDRLLEDKVLLSLECDSPSTVTLAIEILSRTGAEQTRSTVP